MAICDAIINVAATENPNDSIAKNLAYSNQLIEQSIEIIRCLFHQRWNLTDGQP